MVYDKYTIAKIISTTKVLMVFFFRSKAGKRKTKVKKHTLNPVFEEILKVKMIQN